MEGEAISLNCEVDGSPAPSVTWQFFHNMVTYNLTSDSIKYIISNSTLTILDVTPSDSGKYRCTATNIIGTISADVQLVVLGEICV